MLLPAAERELSHSPRIFHGGCAVCLNIESDLLKLWCAILGLKQEGCIPGLRGVIRNLKRSSMVRCHHINWAWPRFARVLAEPRTVFSPLAIPESSSRHLWLPLLRIHILTHVWGAGERTRIPPEYVRLRYRFEAARVHRHEVLSI